MSFLRSCVNPVVLFCHAQVNGSTSMKPDLRDIHSIPAGKVDAAVLDQIPVPDAYPHFTPFVENKKQVPLDGATPTVMSAWARHQQVLNFALCWQSLGGCFKIAELGPCCAPPVPHRVHRACMTTSGVATAQQNITEVCRPAQHGIIKLHPQHTYSWLCPAC